ncbi:MAG TPA: 4-hydroxythreonine-4-phosphate dehydrogenase PdxA [Burkholderiales bacterium]|nr:4-hydroxythreonine-4-phosphate dehydrogenase PdxA [Burkholderiales bacterium]
MPHTKSLATLAVTAGEPAGIGPDLCVLLAWHKLPARIVVIADKTLLAERAMMLKKNIHLVDFTPGNATGRASGSLLVLHEPLAKPAVPGKPDPANSGYVLRTLQQAVRGCMKKHFDAMVTAPVHKGVINDAGIPFTGHTEYLAQQTATRQVVMLLTGGGLRVALATTHLALKDVPAALSRNGLERCLRILHQDLVMRFGIAAPRILVAGLNPHAGESGYLGNEETQIIGPVVKKLRHEGFDVQGPLPADTLFTHERLKSCDCVLAMYHDQGLPVLKYASFGSGVNVTLGLPIIRTSVDHGTALELAGTGNIDSGSMLAAIKLALQLSNNAKRQNTRSSAQTLPANVKKLPRTQR